jgi:hypothetical protein
LDSQDKSAVIAKNMYYLNQEGKKPIFSGIPKVMKTSNFSKVLA